MAIKLRRFEGLKSKTFTSEEAELVDYNFWMIEGGLNSVGAITPSPGGGSGGLPGSVISHHVLSDLTTYDDHSQYLLLAGRTGGQTIQSDFFKPVSFVDGVTSVVILPGQTDVISLQSSGTPYVRIRSSANLLLGIGASTLLTLSPTTISTSSPGTDLTLQAGISNILKLTGGSGTSSIQLSNLVQNLTALLDLSLLSISTPRTYRFPDVSGIFALIDATQTFTALQTFQNAGDTPKVIIKGSAAQTSSILQFQNSAGGVLSTFDSNGIFVGGINASTTSQFPDNLLTIYDGANANRTAQFVCDSLTAGSPRSFTFPDASGTFGLLSFAQTWSALNTYSAGINLTSSPNITVSSANAKRTIILSAAGGVATTTSGCGGPTHLESTTNKNNYWALEYDTTTEENAFWIVQLPDNYDGSTVTARFVWTNAAGLTTETVVWGIKARAYADGDTIDAAFGTEVTTSDTWIGQNKVHISAASSAITIGGSPAGGQWMLVNVARKVASDNMTGDARLVAVYLKYGLNAYSD